MGAEQGKGGGRRRKSKLFLPLIFMGRVSSLVDKMDELGVLTRMQREYQEGDICFTKISLQ